MRAAVTRGGRAGGGRGRRPACRPRATWWCARWPPASAAPTSTPWRTSPISPGLMDRSACRRSTRRPTACSATSSAPRSSSTGPTPPARCRWGRRVCSVPDRRRPDRRGADRLLQPLPGRAGRAHGAPGDAPASRCPTSLDTDLAALTEPLAVGEHAVGLAGLAPGQPCLVVGLRAGGAGGHRRPQGPGARPRAGGRLLAHPTPAGRGVRGRRGRRPGRGLAARPLGDFGVPRDDHGAGRGRHARRRRPRTR